MDPVSAAFGIVTGLGATVKLIKTLVDDWKEAPGDLLSVAEELEFVQALLQDICENAKTHEIKVSATTHNHLEKVLCSCSRIATEMQELLNRFKPAEKIDKAGWVTSGKTNMERLRQDLHLVKTSLGLVLNLVLR
jgi:hypothetical protein